MNKPESILGIDPDIEKSGFALLDMRQRTFTMVQALTISEAIKTLDALAASNTPPLVVIEDSDESRNWHTDYYFKEMAQSHFSALVCKRVLGKAAAVGRNTGLCHAISRVLKEYADSVGLKVQMQKPLRKCWGGKDRKITHEECLQFMNGVPKRTNAEERDSMLLSWVVADLPIRIPPKK